MGDARRHGARASAVTLASFALQLLNGLASASALFLVAAGLTLIFGVTRVVNFAHGSLFMLGAYLAWSLGDAFGDGASRTGERLAAASLVGALGALIEFVLLKRLYAAPELLQLTATFGIVLVVRDATLAIWGAEDRLGPRVPWLDGTLDIAGRAIPEYDLFLIVVGPLVLLALTWLRHPHALRHAGARRFREPRARRCARRAAGRALHDRVRAGGVPRRARRRAAAAARAGEPQHGPGGRGRSVRGHGGRRPGLDPRAHSWRHC